MALQDQGPNYPAMNDVRPAEVSAWMKNHRKWTDVPIKDLDGFRKAWWSWWSALQPEARMADADRRNNEAMKVPSVDMDWEKLRKPGKNGLLLIMLALAWWGASSDDDRWKKAVADVSAVIRCMGSVEGATIVTTKKPTRKRGRAKDERGEGSSESKREKRRRR